MQGQGNPQWEWRTRGSLKARNPAGEGIGVLRPETPGNFRLARAVGSTKTLQQKVTQHLKETKYEQP
jgi:hypothetical protein